MKNYKAFTLVETMVVMVILGIIASIMMSSFKPNDAKNKALKTKAEKILSEIDGAAGQIIINSTNGTLAVSNSTGLKTAFETYMTFRQNASPGASSHCSANSSVVAYLKDGACLGFVHGAITSAYIPGGTAATYTVSNITDYIQLDVNGNDPPNASYIDQYKIPINANGIVY